MSIPSPPSLKMSLKRSSSWSLRVVDSQSPSYNPIFDNTPTKQDLFQKSLDGALLSENSFGSNTPSSFPSSYPHTRPRFGSTTIASSSRQFSPGTSYGSYISSPEALSDDEVCLEEDEEIKSTELPALKESDLEASINMVVAEMISSQHGSVTYPCYVSVKPKKEILAEQVSVDLIIILDFKYNELSSFTSVLKNFLPYLSEKDRLSLFMTQRIKNKRFSFRAMDEPTKGELLHEFKFLSGCQVNSHKNWPLSHVFKSAMKSLEDRKYKNHVSAVMIFTDNANNVEFSNFVNQDMIEDPLIFIFGIGQKHNPIVLQEICEHYEGKYHHSDTFEGLNKPIKEYFSEFGFIRAKNIKLSIEIGSRGCDSQGVKISKVYEKKELLEQCTRSFKTQRNYFSVKDGIDVALELELARCKPGLDVKENTYYLEFKLTGEHLAHTSQINLTFRRELTVKSMHPLLLVRREIDRNTLENFYQLKVAKKVFESYKMANSGCVSHGIQHLNDLKKELYTLAVFKSEAIQGMMQNIDLSLNRLNSPSARVKGKFLLTRM